MNLETLHNTVKPEVPTVSALMDSVMVDSKRWAGVSYYILRKDIQPLSLAKNIAAARQKGKESIDGKMIDSVMVTRNELADYEKAVLQNHFRATGKGNLIVKVKSKESKRFLYVDASFLSLFYRGLKDNSYEWASKLIRLKIKNNTSPLLLMLHDRIKAYIMPFSYSIDEYQEEEVVVAQEKKK
jgi:hypothetical protein